MTPTEIAPVAPEDQLLPAAAESEVPAESEAAAATAAQPDPEVKKLRDRLAEQGRKNAEIQRLAQQQSQQIANLSTQLGNVNQYLSQQQQANVKAQLAGMEPEQQIAYLADQVLRLSNQPARVVQPPVQETAPVDPRVAAAVDDINAEFGLDDDPITAEEVGVHPDEASWRKAAAMIAKAKAATVPAKKPENSKSLSEDQIIEKAAQRLRTEMGIGRPNAASPTAASKGGMSIEGLNKMVADNSMSPRARVEKMRKLAE